MFRLANFLDLFSFFLFCWWNRSPNVSIDLNSIEEVEDGEEGEDENDSVGAFSLWDRFGIGDGDQFNWTQSDDESDEEMSILPEPNDCGVEASNNRIYGGDFTSLTEYPW